MAEVPPQATAGPNLQERKNLVDEALTFVAQFDQNQDGGNSDNSDQGENKIVTPPRAVRVEYVGITDEPGGASAWPFETLVAERLVRINANVILKSLFVFTLYKELFRIVDPHAEVRRRLWLKLEKGLSFILYIILGLFPVQIGVIMMDAGMFGHWIFFAIMICALCMAHISLIQGHDPRRPDLRRLDANQPLLSQEDWEREQREIACYFDNGTVRWLLARKELLPICDKIMFLHQVWLWRTSTEAQRYKYQEQINNMISCLHQSGYRVTFEKRPIAAIAKLLPVSTNRPDLRDRTSVGAFAKIVDANNHGVMVMLLGDNGYVCEYFAIADDQIVKLIDNPHI